MGRGRTASGHHQHVTRNGNFIWNHQGCRGLCRFKRRAAHCIGRVSVSFLVSFYMGKQTNKTYADTRNKPLYFFISHSILDLVFLVDSLLVFLTFLGTHFNRNGASFEPPVLSNFPADYPNVLSVAAVDQDKKHAIFRYVCFVVHGTRGGGSIKWSSLLLPPSVAPLLLRHQQSNNNNITLWYHHHFLSLTY